MALTAAAWAATNVVEQVVQAAKVRRSLPMLRFGSTTPKDLRYPRHSNAVAVAGSVAPRADITMDLNMDILFIQPNSGTLAQNN